MASKSSVTNALATLYEDYFVYRRSNFASEPGWLFGLGLISIVRETFVCQGRLDGFGQGICLSILGTHFLPLYHNIWLKTSTRG